VPNTSRSMDIRSEYSRIESTPRTRGVRRGIITARLANAQPRTSQRAIGRPARLEDAGHRGAAMLYFAYGSDLDPAEMKAMCPGHHVVGLALLADHRLGFPLYSHQ